MSKKSKPRLYLIVVLGGLLLLALVVYLCVPYAPRTTAELCGTYVLDCELVKEELALRPDGTFSQTITIKSTSEDIPSEGTWKYDAPASGGPTDGYVTLDGLVVVLKWPDELCPDYAHQRPGLVMLPAEYWFGRLELGGMVDSWPQWKKVK